MHYPSNGELFKATRTKQFIGQKNENQSENTDFEKISDIEDGGHFNPPSWKK